MNFSTFFNTTPYEDEISTSLKESWRESKITKKFLFKLSFNSSLGRRRSCPLEVGPLRETNLSKQSKHLKKFRRWNLKKMITKVQTWYSTLQKITGICILSLDLHLKIWRFQRRIINTPQDQTPNDTFELEECVFEVTRMFPWLNEHFNPDTWKLQRCRHV